MNFVYTAMNARGERLTDVLECADAAEARRAVMERGLYVMSLEPRKAPAAQGRAAPGGFHRPWRRVRGRDVALFTRQMSMMLSAGSPVVPAIRAIAEQPGRADWRRVLSGLADAVEGGSTLRDAMAAQPAHFDGAFRCVVGAGEATGKLAESFRRLSATLEARERVRKVVTGALVYPSLLLLMAVSVLLSMAFFVLPRFAELFKMLDVELPVMTRTLLSCAAWLKQAGPVVAILPLGCLAAAGLWLRTRRGRAAAARLIMRLPVIGPALCGVLLAKLLRTWGAMLRSNVPLLETIRQTRGITPNPQFRRLIDETIEAVTAGKEIHTVLRASPLVPATITAAIATGEQSGRLGESLEYVATWLEELNEARIGTLTRLLEPTILVFLGVVVGTVSISLFLPLFEVATAA